MSHMKTVIICGVARSGKTTLAKMLGDQLGYSVVCTDDLVGPFHHSFEELGISHADEFKTSESIARFLHNYFYTLSKNKAFNYIIEGYYMFPQDMAKFKHRDDFEIVYLAYPKLTAKQIFDAIRKNDNKDDWTFAVPDEFLMARCEIFEKISKMIEEDCKKFGFAFYDVSSDRETVLKYVKNMLIKNLIS